MCILNGILYLTETLQKRSYTHIFYEVKIRINEYKTDFTAVFFTASF